MEEVGKVSSGDTSQIEGAGAVRMLRDLKILRVLRIFRVFRFFEELRVVIASITGSMRSLFWTFVLLFCVVYASSIGILMMVTSYDDAYEGKERAHRIEWFGSMEDTMIMLFQTCMGGLSWAEVMTSFRALSFVATAVYAFYISFVFFAVLNVITGVFLEQAVKASANDRDSLAAK